MKLQALKTSAFLGILFLLVYGTCNWLTSLRTDVGTLYFEWERHIPFVPWMIVPYMSIDLFFLGAPFFCRNQQELRTLSRRITFVILAAGVCFLLFPLKFAFDRPPGSGWLGTVFDAFRAMDKPFNLAPSLHIALLMILAGVYARRARGAWKNALHVWFSLIGFSTVLTYQHHVLDIVAGFVLAAYGVFLFPDSAGKLPVVSNQRVGAYYGGASLALVAIAWLLRSWSILLLWPAGALAIVSSSYFGFGPGFYRKTNGRLALSSRLFLWPGLLGQHFSLAYYRRQCRPWDAVLPSVWIGRKLTDSEAKDAVQRGVTAVLDLTVEFDEAQPFLDVCYRNIPILDLTAPTQAQLEAMAEFIEVQSREGVVYIHCKVGYSRSAAAVAAFLLRSGRINTVEEGIHKLRSVRPPIVVRPEIMAALKQFEQSGSKMLPSVNVPPDGSSNAFLTAKQPTIP